jgi:hypothetical protein
MISSACRLDALSLPFAHFDAAFLALSKGPMPPNRHFQKGRCHFLVTFGDGDAAKRIPGGVYWFTEFSGPLDRGEQKRLQNGALGR